MLKKILIAVFILLSFLTVIFYLLFPKNIDVVKSKQLKNNIPGLFRVLANQAGWKGWWPQKQSGRDSYYTLGNNRYRIQDETTSSIFLEVGNKNFEHLRVSLNFIPDEKGSLKLEMSTVLPSSNNFFTKIKTYFLSKELDGEFSELLNSIDKYYSSTENMYGININRGTVNNTIFVMTYDSVKNYPTTENIYSLVNELRQYVAKENAKVLDSPMVNIYTKDSITYVAKVALPINKEIGNSGKISFKKMLPGGNMLSARVTGGVNTVNSAFKSMEQYINDYHLEAPAIPFYVLITNRQQQPDSTKWSGEINYPIMYY